MFVIYENIYYSLADEHQKIYKYIKKTESR